MFVDHVIFHNFLVYQGMIRNKKNGEISNKQDTLVIPEIFKAKILKLLLIYLKKVIFVSKLYKILLNYFRFFV